VFRQCDVYLFWPRNDSENVERRTHIPQTLNSMSVHMESTSVKGKHQRRILTFKELFFFALFFYFRRALKLKTHVFEELISLRATLVHLRPHDLH
jgi:hypothetical protein